MPRDIVNLYLEAFVRKDLVGVNALFADNVVLQDPFAGKVTGRENVARVFRDIFKARKLELQPTRRFVGDDGSVAQEFTLNVTDAAGFRTELAGVDLFEIADGRIHVIRAYVEARPAAAR